MATISIGEDDETLTKPLGRRSVLYYGVGQMLNDMVASCWFTYLLVFLTDIGLSPRDSAIVMLSGQISDAFATILTGELIDRFGNFKIWHGAGSVLVAVSFSSVFGGCLPCKLLKYSSSSTMKTVSYSIFGVISNVGLAAAQISHMSMANCITLNSTSRVVLASCRNAFTMVANLSLNGVALVVFSVTPAETQSDIENQFCWIAYLSIFIGGCFVGIFHLETEEPRLKIVTQGSRRAGIPWSYWFKRLLYYQVALVYTLTRLLVNVSQAYLAFYVMNDLGMLQSAKALVPAIINISSFIVSVSMQEVPWTSYRVKAYFAAGGLIWAFCGAVILVLPMSMSALMYILSIFIGVATTLMMVTGVSMQSALIDRDLDGCVFVCSSFSFSDKAACGLALFILQSFQNTDMDPSNSNPPFISVTRLGFGFVPAFSSLMAVVVTYTMQLDRPHLEPLLES